MVECHPRTLLQTCKLPHPLDHWCLCHWLWALFFSHEVEQVQALWVCGVQPNIYIYNAKSFQSCPTLCNPVDGSPPGSAVPRFIQARTLDWVAISFSSEWKWKVKVKSLSCVQLLVTPSTAVYQAPPIHGIFQARVLEWGVIAYIYIWKIYIYIYIFIYSSILSSDIYEKLIYMEELIYIYILIYMEELSWNVIFHIYIDESESHSAVSDSLRPYELYSPWNSPGQNTGMGSLSLL